MDGFIPLNWLCRPWLIAKLAASDAALFTRNPEDKLRTDAARLFCASARLFCANSEETLVLIDSIRNPSKCALRNLESATSTNGFLFQSVYIRPRDNINKINGLCSKDLKLGPLVPLNWQSHGKFCPPLTTRVGNWTIAPLKDVLAQPKPEPHSCLFGAW